MQPTIGRIVIYKLTAEDAIQINRRRTTGESIKERMTVFGDRPLWPEGAQAHIGSAAYVGQELPMIIVKTNGGSDIVNGQVLLDGNDVLWKQSVPYTVSSLEARGSWKWPEKV